MKVKAGLLSFLFLVTKCFAASVSPVLSPLPNEAVFWIDTDVGFDVDDLIAMVAVTKHAGSRIVGVSTTLYRPDRKAALTKLVLGELGFPNVPVFAGLGVYQDSESKFYSIYPTWPKQFGAPYSKQGLAFENVYGKSALSTSKDFVQGEAIDALISAVHQHSGKLVVMALGPLTNIAAALKRDPSIAKEICRLDVMGGWFLKDGKPDRLGYNTLLDIKASAEVFGNSKLQTVIINSQAIKDANMRIKRDQEYSQLTKSQEKSKLGSALFQDMGNWLDHSKNTMGDIVLADPITAMVAVFPNLVATARTINVTFLNASEGNQQNSVMNGGLQVKDEKKSPHLYLVETFRSPELVREDVIRSLQKLAKPKASVPNVDLGSL